MAKLAEDGANGSFDLNKLSGPQRALLREALLVAFTRPAFDQMLQNNDENKRLDILTTDSALRTQLFELVLLTQMEGWTDTLVAWAQKARPDHARIKSIVSDLRMLKSIEADARFVDRSLEQTVKARSDTMEMEEWVLGFIQLRSAVCRVEDPRDPRKALGTGFLVAPDLLLTNYHVMENYLGEAPQRDISTLAFRFDYALESTGENYGKIVSAAVDNWLVSEAPYRTAANGTVPDLDYALIRLAVPVGNDLLGGPLVGEGLAGKVARGWLQLSSLVPVPSDKDVIFIPQHPRGQSMRMAVGTVLAKPDGHIRYDTETQAGSSGSPCLDATLKLVALHQGSNSDRPKETPYNEGIRIDAIINHLAAKGVPKFWV